MKKISNIAIILASTSVLFSSVNVASANTIPKENVNDHQVMSQKQLSPEQLQSYDKYVKVINNQYVLDPSISSKIDGETIKTIQNQINISNSNIKNNDLTINTDKTIANNDLVNYSTSRPAHETRNYWWGVKHIFRSNAAVNNFNHGLLTIASTATGGYLFGVGGGAAAAVSQVYLLNLTNDLGTFNANHPKNKIYLDVPLSFYPYHYGIWHD